MSSSYENQHSHSEQGKATPCKASLCFLNKNGISPLEKVVALAGVASLVGRRLTKQRVTSSIPGEGTCLGCRLRPHSGHVQEATD